MTSNTKRSEPTLTPVNSSERRDAIIEAISNYKIQESNAWNVLDSLSSNTDVDAIEANAEGIFDAGPGKFEATATVYVILNYGDKRDSLTTTDAFPVHVTGTISDDNIVSIEEFSVDTSSFFGIAEEDDSSDSSRHKLESEN